jgi:hypothetical protein
MLYCVTFVTICQSALYGFRLVHLKLMIFTTLNYINIHQLYMMLFTL